MAQVMKHGRNMGATIDRWLDLPEALDLGFSFNRFLEKLLIGALAVYFTSRNTRSHSKTIKDLKTLMFALAVDITQPTLASKFVELHLNQFSLFAGFGFGFLDGSSSAGLSGLGHHPRLGFVHLRLALCLCLEALQPGQARRGPVGSFARGLESKAESEDRSESKGMMKKTLESKAYLNKSLG